MLLLQPQNADLPSHYSHRKRPHLYPGGATFMIGMRLHGSITRPAARKVLALQKQYGQAIPGHLYWAATAEEREGYKQMMAAPVNRRALNGPFHLHHSEECRQILVDAINFREGIEYETIAYSLMPNHLHWVVRHLSRHLHMGELLYRLRKFVGRKSNAVLDLVGEPYFERESYDHIITSQEELVSQVKYTLHNPTVCGLAKHWRDWPGNYLHPGWRTRDGRGAGAGQA